VSIHYAALRKLRNYGLLVFELALLALQLGVTETLPNDHLVKPPVHLPEPHIEGPQVRSGPTSRRTLLFAYPDVHTLLFSTLLKSS
jgi:hypothetical protein